jgi:hypothetical protein
MPGALKQVLAAAAKKGRHLRTSLFPDLASRFPAIMWPKLGNWVAKCFLGSR